MPPFYILKNEKELENTMENINYILPLVAMRGLTLFPFQSATFDVGRDNSKAALSAAAEHDGQVLLVSQLNPEELQPDVKNLSSVGVVAKIKQVFKTANNILRVYVTVESRVKIVNYTSIDPYFSAYHIPFNTFVKDDVKFEVLKREMIKITDEYIKLVQKTNPVNDFNGLKKVDYANEINNNTENFIYTFSAVAIKDENTKLSVLSSPALDEQLEILLSAAAKECEFLKLESIIANKVRDQINKANKEVYLREQIKAINEELGGGISEADELKDKINKAKLPKDVRDKALKETERLAAIPISSPENAMIRNYLDWLLDLPWKKAGRTSYNLQKAERILNEDHYGLDKVKERILEHIAVMKLSKNTKGTILCFVGPPGTGKTSVAHSIARALNRKFVRISLGGVSDEADIRGHRRTYVGAAPGRIMYALKEAGVNNPVILLDEIDKLTHNYRGDPASALLELLDPHQNSNFRDHFIELPFDMKDVMFITTANSVDTIPEPLFDRMEIIHLSGYTEDEKIEIAKHYIISRQEKENGLKQNTIDIDDKTLAFIINGYTRESGVRGLERELATIARKCAKKILTENINSNNAHIKITQDEIKEFLGPVQYFKEDNDILPDEAGVVTGLAWTAFGGQTLDIEVILMKGEGEITITGQLGDVMQESAKTALSYVKANAEKYNINPDVFSKTNLHIHVPEGAIKKDGPSAGITLATAILSAFTSKPVKNDVAMTGEITLRGRVLAIGGLREKTLAALRAGIKTVIIPKGNEKDLEELPQKVKDGIKIIPVSKINEVFEIAFS